MLLPPVERWSGSCNNDCCVQGAGGEPDGPGHCLQWRSGQEAATMIVVYRELEESLTGRVIASSGEVVRKLQQ